MTTINELIQRYGCQLDPKPTGEAGPFDDMDLGHEVSAEQVAPGASWVTIQEPIYMGMTEPDELKARFPLFFAD